jgi:iron(III) transport system substrate-binding protein
MRAADHPYNLALFAGMIAAKGEDYTRTWLRGLRSNLAVTPNGGDREQAKSIFAGECDVALGNTYYVGLMAHNDNEPEQKDWAKAIKVLFPSSAQMKTHVNVSGMLLAKYAPNAANAKLFMEFLASDEAQRLYADQNYEYPVNPDVPASDYVMSLGKLSPGDAHVGDIAKFQARAARLVEETGFNR